MIWLLPEYKTFMDGRMAAWQLGKDRYILDDYIAITTDPYNNEELLNTYINKYNIKSAFMARDEAKYPTLIEYLINKRNWKKTYEDKVSVIVQDVNTK